MRLKTGRIVSFAVLLATLVLPTQGKPSTQPRQAGTAMHSFLQAVRARSQLETLLGVAPVETSAEEVPDMLVAIRTTGIVEKGRTLWEIARQYGTNAEELTRVNRLRSAELIRVGQQLALPPGTVIEALAIRDATRVPGTPDPGATPRDQAKLPTRMTTIVVRPGETLWDLAQVHRVTVEDIAKVNGLKETHYIQAGQRLNIPESPKAQARGSSVIMEVPPATVSIVRGLLWPTRGWLTSRFGRRWSRHHDGIDIAAPYGVPIYASKDGRVVFANWYFGYGRTVIIDHGDGVRTLYGHASKILVHTGREIEAGQEIARVGSTGRTTGPHVHFEIRINGHPVDPLRYLISAANQAGSDPAGAPANNVTSAAEARSTGVASRVVYHAKAGAFRQQGNAEAIVRRLEQDGFEASIVHTGGLYKVLVGIFDTREGAARLVEALKIKKYDAYVTREDPSSGP